MSITDKRRIYHYGFHSRGKQRICDGCSITPPQQFVTWECSNRTETTIGVIFQRPVFRAEGFGGARAVGGAVPGGTGVKPQAPDGAAQFPMGKNPGA